MATDNPILLAANSDAVGVDITADSTLKAVEEALAVSAVSTEELRAETKKNVAATREATSALTSAVGELTSANKITERARLNADLQEQNANQAVLAAGGGQESQVKLLSNLTEKQEDVEALLVERRDILNDEPTGFFPLDSIINAIRTLPVNSELRAANDQQIQARNQLQSITSAQEAFASVNAHTKKTLTEGVIEANMKRISAEGKILATEQELKNMHSNAIAMTALADADKTSVANRLAVFRLEGEAETRALKIEDQAFRREQMKFKREQWPTQKATAEINLEAAQLRLADAKDSTPERRNAAKSQLNAVVKKNSDALLFQEDAVNAVHRSQSVVGLPIETPETIMFKMFNAPTQAKYVRMHELGASAKPVLGLSPFEATSNLRLIDSSGVSPKTKYTRLLDTAAQIQLDRYTDANVKIPKDRTQIETDYNQAASDMMLLHTNEIKQGDSSNPLHAPPFETLATKRSVSETALYQKVLKAKGMVETDAQTIVDSALAGVLAKSITMEEAAEGIEAIYDAAALHNNEDMGGFERVGLPSQTTYSVKLDRDVTVFETLAAGGGLLAGTAVDKLTAGVPSIIKPKTATDLAIFKAATAGFISVDLMDIVSVKQMLVLSRSSIGAKVEDEAKKLSEQEGEE